MNFLINKMRFIFLVILLILSANVFARVSLIREAKVSSQEEYYADSLLTIPKLSRSVSNNFLYGFAKPIVIFFDVNDASPEGKAIHDYLKVVELENATPGIESGQKVADCIAKLIGYGFNPIVWSLFLLAGYMPYLLYRKFCRKIL